MKRQLLVGTAIVASVSALHAQEARVSGVVISSEDNLPVIGASVVVKGSASGGNVKGVATDLDGKFTLQIPSGREVTLEISFLGMQKREVKVRSGQKDVRIVLNPDSQQLKDVMVVAYGSTTKNAFTGSASKVSMEKLQAKSTSNITKALEGEVPGVQVFSTSGQPGEAATIQIRGIGSLNSSTAPLYVIDGVPYGAGRNGLTVDNQGAGNALSSISPSDIASMTVLKDASATALYGARAANGVVLITTHQGKAGKVTVDANVSYGINTRLIPQHDVITSPEHFMEIAYASMVNAYNTRIKGQLDRAYTPSASYIAGKSYADRPTTPGDLLFFDGILNGRGDAGNSLATYYNMWDAPSGSLIDPTTGRFNPNIKRRYTPENWEDELFRTGERIEAGVRLSGGKEGIQFFSSLGYQTEKGYYIGSDFERFTLRNNVTANVTPNLKATLGLSYAYTDRNSPGQASLANNGLSFAATVPPIFGVYRRDENGKYLQDQFGRQAYDFGQGVRRPFLNGMNPVATTALDVNNLNRHAVTGNLNVDYRFLNDFKATLTYGKQANFSYESELSNPFYGDSEGVGRTEKTGYLYQSDVFTQLLSWGHKYGKHNVDAFVAHESTESKSELLYGRRALLIEAERPDLNNAVKVEDAQSYTWRHFLESYFGQARYDYDGKYFVSASIRRDGSSRFSKDNRWGTFGSVGTAWLMSAENFMKSAKWVNSLKLKASYGLLGNENVADYLTYDLYSIGNTNDLPTFTFRRKGNPNITWEKSETINFGVESELFGILTLNAEYYIKRTRNMIFEKEVAPSLGYSTVNNNDGELLNHGLEMDFSVRALKTKDWAINVRGNVGFYTNKITKMPLDPSTGQPKKFETSYQFGRAEGRSAYDLYMPRYAGVDSKTGEPQWHYYYTSTKDASGKETLTAISSLESWLADSNNNPADLKQGITKSYNDATKVFLDKTAIPDLVGGFGFDVSYKALTLSTSFSFGLGGYALDSQYANLMNTGATIGSYNWHKDIEGAWRKVGDQTSIPRLESNNPNIARFTSQSDYWLTSRSYLNFNNVRLSYELPKSLISKVKLSSASVYVSGDNIFLLSARKGFVSMSSVTGTSSSYRYLPMSTFTAGLNIKL